MRLRDSRRTSLRVGSVLAGLLALTAGCRSADAQTGLPSAEQRRRNAWPAAEVARSTADAELSQVTDLAVDSRGQIYVGDWYQQRVTVFSPNGGVVRTIGRKGAGPGEFESIRGVQILAGDSLMVYDPSQARVTVYAPGAARESYVVNLGPRLRGEPPFFLWRTRSNRGYVAFYRPAFMFTGGRTSTERMDSVVMLDLDGSPRGGGVLRFSSRSFLVASTSVTPNPFGRQGIVRLNPEDRIHFAWTGALAVETYDLQARRLGRFSTPYVPPRIRRADVAEGLEGMGAWGKRTFARVLRDSLPDRWPAVEEMLVDDRGRLWLSLAGPHERHVEWVLFSSDGRYQGSVLLPPEVELRLVQGGKLYGTRTDDTGVPRIVTFQLSRAPVSR